MQTGYGLSARREDRVLRLSRSARHYSPRERDDGALIAAIEAHLKDSPGHGFELLMDYAVRPLGCALCQRINSELSSHPSYFFSDSFQNE